MALRLATDTRNRACDAIVDDIDAGSGAGTIKGYTGAQVGSVGGSEGGNMLLFTCTFGDPAFGAASSGAATANAITGDSSADASGTCGHANIADSDGNAHSDMTAGSGSGDLNFSTTNIIVAGGTVAISSMTLTVPV